MDDLLYTEPSWYIEPKHKCKNIKCFKDCRIPLLLSHLAVLKTASQIYCVGQKC